jgi:hypothetical protein
VRAQLVVRDRLVRDRAGLVTLAQAILSREGLQVLTGSSGSFGDRVERLGLPEPLTGEIAPLLAMLVPLNEQIGLLDEKLSELGRKDERVKRLMTMPEIGPVTAVAFVATLDEAGRFRGRTKWRPTWGWCRASGARARCRGEATSPSRATPACAGCSWKRHGAWPPTRSGPRRRRCGSGRSASPAAAACASRSWPSPVSSARWSPLMTPSPLCGGAAPAPPARSAVRTPQSRLVAPASGVVATAARGGLLGGRDTLAWAWGPSFGPSLVAIPLLPSMPPRRSSASTISSRARIASTLNTASSSRIPKGAPSASVHALGSLIEKPSGARTTSSRGPVCSTSRASPCSGWCRRVIVTHDGVGVVQ